MRTSATFRRRRRIALLVLVVAVAASWLGVSALVGGGGPGGPGAGRTPVAAARAPGSSTSTTAAPERGLPVVTTQETFTDPTRDVDLDGTVEATGRTLPTDIWLPARPGRYPLVVFAHGYDVGPPTYASFLSQLASSGYVVAAPSFPLEDPSRGFGLDRNDLPNEATDVSFTITSLLRGPLADRIVSSEIGVVGHSDGADVALMVGYQKGLADPRVKAVVADAPDPMSGTVSPTGPPLLLVQGDADSVVPYSSSQEVFRQVPEPTYYLTLVGADHLPPIQGGSAWSPSLDASVADFLDAAIAGRSRVASLGSQLGVLPLTRLQTHG